MDQLTPENEERIYQTKDVTILVKRFADSDAVALLSRTRYGTNGVQYQHTGQAEKVAQLRKPLFFHLLRDGLLIGIYCLDERELTAPNGTVRGFYGRYLSIDSGHAGRGYGRLLKREAVRYVEESVAGPLLFYAYIEERNSRSMAISHKQEFRSIAVLRTFIFRRHQPHQNVNVRRLSPAELADMLVRLGQFYSQYAFRTFAHVGYKGNYFVFQEDGEIVAGVQANPVRWQFYQMPGVGGWVMMNVLPLSSVTRRYFNPEDYQFIVPEGLYVKPGREELLYVLLESVLAHFGFHSALLQLDARDPLLVLLTKPEAGRLSGFQAGVRTHVMVRAKDIPHDQLPTEWPVYVSAFDFT